MWLILVWLVAVVVVFLERAVYIFGAYQEVSVFSVAIIKLVEVGDWKRAVMLSKAAKTPLGRITGAGLMRASEGARAFQEGMDEAALREIPALHQRVEYLALFANLAMLCGLLGTILGLIKSFGSVGAANIDYSEKSKILSSGIAEAMNCTAFGLLTAIVAIIALVIIRTWVEMIEDGIHAETVKIYNVALRCWAH